MTASELSQLQGSLDALTRGVSQMNETLALHGAMLEQILQAASQPPPTSELPELLKAVVGQMQEQGAALETVHATLLDLPEKIAEALVEDARPS